MKANVQRTLNRLTPSERARIETEIYDRLDNELCTAQFIWIKMGCCVLADMGLSADEIILWIGGWKRLYRANSRFKDADEQTNFLNNRLNEIFGECGFPEEFMQSFKEIGRS